MTSAAMKELSKRIESIKSNILYNNRLSVPDKKLMHTWFKFFDQNLKGLEGADIKLNLYSAFKTMADKGVLMPPFHLAPHDKDQKVIKGPTQLSQFSQGYTPGHFKARVEEFIENRKAKERPKSAPARREVKTIVTNKKVIDEAADRRTTISTTLEVISHEPDTDVPSVVPAIVQPKLSKTKLDPAAAQQLKRKRTVTIKNLEEDIIRAGKALSSDKQDMVEAWLKTLNDKLKRETELGDRIFALTALKTSLGARKLLPPFDRVPARGKLNVREFMSQIDLAGMEEKAMSAAPKRKKPTTAPGTAAIIEAPQKKISAPDLSNPQVMNDAIQAIVQNMGKAMNAICAEDMNALEDIPPMADQVEAAVINSPHRTGTAPIHRYKFTPLELHDYPYESETATRPKQRLYKSLKDFEIGENIETEHLPDLETSIYDDGDELFYDNYLIPESVTQQKDLKFSGSEQLITAIDSQYDPVTFAKDSPEFDFIPGDVKAYIKRVVKKELIHWPAFLQDIGRGFNWPQYKGIGELIQFSPFK